MGTFMRYQMEQTVHFLGYYPHIDLFLAAACEQTKQSMKWRVRLVVSRHFKLLSALLRRMFLCKET